MAKSRRRRHCLIGYDERGNPMYAAGKTVRTLLGVAENGKPVPPGCGLASVEFDDEDGEHAMIEDIVPAPHNGPAQVATPAYREGWEKTFN